MSQIITHHSIRNFVNARGKHQLKKNSLLNNQNVNTSQFLIQSVIIKTLEYYYYETLLHLSLSPHQQLGKAVFFIWLTPFKKLHVLY